MIPDSVVGAETTLGIDYPVPWNIRRRVPRILSRA